MRATLKELTDKLGVGYVLSAYETCPWSAYDDEQEMSCSAEVRMDSDAEELEAELQIMRDDPKEGEKPIEQIYHMTARPAVSNKWDVKIAILKGENKAETVYGWEEKTVNFFHACVQELKMGKIPDFDAIIEKEVNKKERFGDKAGGGGNKSPKIKPERVMGIKSGM
ncbi:MAG: hypothetical protein AAGB32_04415 [Pseudomonadota bacterium]